VHWHVPLLLLHALVELSGDRQASWAGTSRPSRVLRL
jgi:hypothetical protein